MQEIKNKVIFLYNHHAIRYLFVGGTTFILDFGLLVLLHGVMNLNLALATTVSYWLSVTYNFTLNRWWTFSASENNKVHRHAAAYLVLLAFNYLFTIGFVYALTHLGMHYSVAKVLAVIIQISWTYPIYRKVIFK